MKRLFIDTGVWVAAISLRDPLHGPANAVLDRVVAGEWQSVHTSDLVITETLNFIRQKIRHPEAAEVFLDHVFGHEDLPPLVSSILRVHSARFAAALERYRQEFDRGLSFTDWSSVILLEQEAIGSLATFDHGFTGLVAHILPE